MNQRIKITDLRDPRLDIYARLSEVQLLRYAEPAPGIFIGESPKVIRRALAAGYKPISFLVADSDLQPGSTGDSGTMAGDSGVYSRGSSAQETDRICNDQRNALRDAKKGLTCSGRHMQRRKKNRNSGECSQPYKCRGNLSFCSSPPYGCGASDRWMQ